jgi:hypothetical protein
MRPRIQEASPSEAEPLRKALRAKAKRRAVEVNYVSTEILPMRVSSS